MSTTYAQVMPLYGIDVPSHLRADAEVPVLRGLQRQGDLLVVPVDDEAAPPPRGTGEPIPMGGVELVRGSATSHAHLLVGAGAWWPTEPPRSDLGEAEIDTEGFVLHPEHGALGLAPGRYRFRRQRELGLHGTSTDIAD